MSLSHHFMTCSSLDIVVFDGLVEHEVGLPLISQPMRDFRKPIVMVIGH